MASHSNPTEMETQILSRLSSPNYDLVKEKKRPVEPFKRFLSWFLMWAIPGAGMFMESYFIFAIGNIKPLLQIDYPNCMGSERPANCNTSVVDNLETIEIAGIIGGMLVLGASADWLGRKWGSRATITIMFVGAIFLSSSAGSATAWLSVFATGLCTFGFGVGGEYPVASASAAEKAEGNPALRKRRGEIVVMTFSMQGVGSLVNVLVIIIFYAATGATGAVISGSDAEWIWRGQFVLGTMMVLVFVYYRWVHLKESKVWEKDRKIVDKEQKREEEANPKMNARLNAYLCIMKRYWSRLLISCGAWVLNDFAFYGSKLFMSTFIAIISPNASQFDRMLWTLLNAAVALTGYWFAAFFIDKKWYGRRRMQMIGFLMMFALFLPCALAYDSLLENYIHVFQFLYFFSSFWNQFGPNCTTWLVAGEIYPTDVRAFFHGLSAACGKAGALVAAHLFESMSNENKYLTSAIAGIIGAVATFFLLPDTTGLDLSELDRHHLYLMNGLENQYHGEAINPRHLSPVERWMGVSKLYDPVADAEQQKLQEMNRFEISKNYKNGSYSDVSSTERNNYDNMP